MQEIKMKDLVIAPQCLGIRILRQNDAIGMDQESYIDEMLKRFNMQDCNSVSTPIDINVNPTRHIQKGTKASKLLYINEAFSDSD